MASIVPGRRRGPDRSGVTGSAHDVVAGQLGLVLVARIGVVAARAGFAKWASATPYNRGQVLYRVAEMMEARRAELVELIGLCHRAYVISEGRITGEVSGSDMTEQKIMSYAIPRRVTEKKLH